MMLTKHGPLVRLFKEGHTYFRRVSDDAVMLTDDSKEELHQLDTELAIWVDTHGFAVHLKGGGASPVSANEAACLAIYFGMKINVGGTIFKRDN